MSKIVVADYYQLTRLADGFTQESKILIRKGVKVAESYVEVSNSNWKDNGKLYVIDEEATKENSAQREFEKANRDKAAEVDALNVEKAIKSIVSKDSVEEKPAPKRRTTKK
jgi:hypothetical protein